MSLLWFNRCARLLLELLHERASGLAADHHYSKVVAQPGRGRGAGQGQGQGQSNAAKRAAASPLACAALASAVAVVCS